MGIHYVQCSNGPTRVTLAICFSRKCTILSILCLSVKPLSISISRSLKYWHVCVLLKDTVFCDHVSGTLNTFEKARPMVSFNSFSAENVVWDYLHVQYYTSF